MEPLAANPEAVHVGEKIIAARKRKGISQVELSRRLGHRLDRDPESVRRTLINNERGRNVPRTRFLKAIADELDQPLEFFFRASVDDDAPGDS